MGFWNTKEKYERAYKQNVLGEHPYEHTIILGKFGVLQLVVSLCLTLMIWLWQDSFKWLWGAIFNFLIILVAGVIVLAIVRLFPPKNRYIGVVYQFKEKGIDKWEILTQFLICAVIGFLNYYLVAQLLGQTLYGGSIQVKLFVVCNSTWEEILFCSLQIFFMRFGRGTGGMIFGIVLRGLLFGFYHILVYGNILAAIVATTTMGFIYGAALIYFNRMDISMGVHLLMNLIAA